MMMRGTMIWFNPNKGFGFIRTDEGEQVLVRADGFAPGSILGDGCAGTAVEFAQERADVEGGAIATQVTIIPEPLGNRARSRRHRL